MTTRTVSHFFDGDCLKQLVSQHSCQKFSDAIGGLMVPQQLEFISTEIFERKYPDLTFINSDILIDNTGGYNSTITSLMDDFEGEFVQAGDKSDNAGNISTSRQASKISVYEMKGSAEWSDSEVQTAAMEGYSVPSRRIAAVNKVYMQTIERIGLIGIDPNNGEQPVLGLLNFGGFDARTASGSHTTLTAQQNYDEIAALITTQWASVNNTSAYRATNVIMPIAVFNYLSTQPYNGTLGEGKTVLQVLMQNFPMITFSYSPYCNEIAHLENNTTATVAFCPANDCMRYRIPMPLQFSPVTQINFDYKVAAKVRIGGLDVLHNKSGLILQGL